MKTIFIFLLFVAASPLISNAQIKGRSYFSLNGGLSVPVGAYSANRYASDINYGFANPGFNLSLETRFHIYKNFGIGLYLGTPFHTPDKTYLSNKVRAAHNYTSPEYNASVGSRLDVYGGAVAMMGVSYSYPFKNIALDLKILGGVSTWARDLEIMVTKPNTGQVIYTERYVFNQGLWPIMQAGTAVRFLTNRRFGLKFGVDFNKVLKGKTNSDIKTYTKEPMDDSFDRASIPKRAIAPVSYFNFEMGIVIHLGKKPDKDDKAGVE